MYTWLQYNKNGIVTAAVLKLENSVTVVCSENADIAEISEFVSAVGFESIMSDTPLELFEVQKDIAVVMKYENIKRSDIEKLEISLSPSLNDVYDVLDSCRSEDFQVAPFDGFYVDMSHRIRHGGGRCAAVYQNNCPTACAMATAITDKKVLLGGVACRPECRRLGFGGAAVSALVSSFKEKDVFLMRQKNQNREFYYSLGFEDSNIIIYLYSPQAI